MHNIVCSILDGTTEYPTPYSFVEVVEILTESDMKLNGFGANKEVIKFRSTQDSNFVVCIYRDGFIDLVDDLFNHPDKVSNLEYYFLEKCGLINFYESLDNSKDLDYQFNKQNTNEFKNINAQKGKYTNNGLLLNKYRIFYFLERLKSICYSPVYDFVKHQELMKRYNAVNNSSMPLKINAKKIDENNKDITFQFIGNEIVCTNRGIIVGAVPYKDIKIKDNMFEDRLHIILAETKNKQILCQGLYEDIEDKLNYNFKELMCIKKNDKYAVFTNADKSSSKIVMIPRQDLNQLENNISTNYNKVHPMDFKFLNDFKIIDIYENDKLNPHGYPTYYKKCSIPVKDRFGSYRRDTITYLGFIYLTNMLDIYTLHKSKPLYNNHRLQINLYKFNYTEFKNKVTDEFNRLTAEYKDKPYQPFYLMGDVGSQIIEEFRQLDLNNNLYYSGLVENIKLKPISLRDNNIGYKYQNLIFYNYNDEYLISIPNLEEIDIYLSLNLYNFVHPLDYKFLKDFDIIELNYTDDVINHLEDKLKEYQKSTQNKTSKLEL